MRADAHVGAEGDLDPVLVGLGGGVLDQRADPRRLGPHHLGEVAVELGLVGDEAAGVDGGHVPGAFLLHQAHDLVGHVGAVFDRGHPAEDRALHALGAVGVGGDAIAVIACGVDDGLDFLDGELRRVAGLGVAEHAAGGGDLDHVAAFLVTLAHGLAGVVDRVDHALGRAGRADQVGERVVVAVGRVGVAAGGGDGLAGGPDPRAVDQALVDRVAQVRADLAAEVAHAGEAGQQGLLGVADRAEGEVDLVQAEALGIALRAGLRAQVHVQVGPAGAAGVAGQVDGAGARGFGAAGQDLGDLALAHHHGACLQDLAVARVEQASALQRQRFGGGGGPGEGGDGGGQHGDDGGGEAGHGRFPVRDGRRKARSKHAPGAAADAKSHGRPGSARQKSPARAAPRMAAVCALR